MAVPGHGNGTAGPGGFHAAPILITSNSDTASVLFAFATAHDHGARVVSMSFGGHVPPLLASLDPLGAGTRIANRLNMLLIAAAGNSGVDVDACHKTWWHTCLQKQTWVPCQLDDVLCVGGLAEGRDQADSRSNYGSHHDSPHSVGIFGPFCVYGAPNEGYSTRTDSVHLTCGTSLSAPFVAGVASMVVAANHSLSPEQLTDLLEKNAHGSGDSRVSRIVNATAAVNAALGIAP
jgi:subtilisin family serine protease